MTLIGQAMATAAGRLVGADFRLHGRDPETGLDCVGVVAATFEGAGLHAYAPHHYGLRNSDISAALAMIKRNHLSQVCGSILPGDILLVRPGPAQFHLIVAEHAQSFIHAHAGLRRTVRTPGPPGWPIDLHLRRISKD